MKVIDLIQDIEDILETAGGFPLTGKVMVDPGEIRDILKEIKQELPEEILDDAKAEYDRVISVANEKADQLVENDAITLRAKKRADEIMRVTEENVRELKMGTFEYIDNVLSTFQDKITSMNDTYIQRMIADINDLFEKMNSTIDANRDEIKTLSYRTEAEIE